MIWLDISVLIFGWAIGQFVFNGFEAHVPWRRRIMKFVVIAGILTIFHQVIGRWLFYTALIAMSLGIALLHGYWFHYRHGIHWRTAQPREKYLALIGAHDRFPPPKNDR